MKQWTAKVARVENNNVVLYTQAKGDWRPMPLSWGADEPPAGKVITVNVNTDSKPWEIESWEFAPERDGAPDNSRPVQQNQGNGQAQGYRQPPPQQAPRDDERQLLITSTAVYKELLRSRLQGPEPVQAHELAAEAVLHAYTLIQKVKETSNESLI